MTLRNLMYGGLAALAILTAGCGESAAASVTATPTATETAGFYGNWTPTPEPTPTDTPTPAHTPAPTATPRPTPDQNKQQAMAYVDVVTRDSTRLGQALNQVGQYCGSQDLSMCRLGLTDVERLARGFLGDLDMNPAPPCLSLADIQLRQALRDYQYGARQGVDGIDLGDASMISAGATAIRRATDYTNRATSLVSSASC